MQNSRFIFCSRWYSLADSHGATHPAAITYGVLYQLVIDAKLTRAQFEQVTKHITKKYNLTEAEIFKFSAWRNRSKRFTSVSMNGGDTGQSRFLQQLCDETTSMAAESLFQHPLVRKWGDEWFGKDKVLKGIWNDMKNVKENKWGTNEDGERKKFWYAVKNI